MSFEAELLTERRAFYARAGGGAALPLAGFVYWSLLAWIGAAFDEATWVMAAFYGSGLIFPLGLLLAKPTHSRPLAKSAFGGATFAGLMAALLTWPMIFAAASVDRSLAPLMLAIGLSLHWPIIGWIYGRPLMFAAHAVVRALAVTAVWTLMPEHRFDLLPAVVAIIYGASFLGILGTRPRTPPQKADLAAA